MEFTVDKKTLENAMTNIVSVAPAKAIKPILSSVLIECSDAVYLYATDMETSIRIKLVEDGNASHYIMPIRSTEV